MADDLTALNHGIDMAAHPDPERAQALARERSDVARWFGKYDAARKFDEDARKQYVRDRRYARGDSGFQVDANLIGNYIDILESFLYARDPDVDVTPGPVHRMPSVDVLRDAVEDMMAAQLEGASLEAGKQAAAQAVLMGVPPDQAVLQGQMAQQGAMDQAIADEVAKLRKTYARKSREIKSFCETSEICASRMWQDARLKKRGRPWVRSALTVGVGILKASWQERTAVAPETQTKINDLQANIAKAKALRTQLESGEAGLLAQGWDALKGVFGKDEEAKLADLERQLQAIRAGAERVVARGFVVDLTAAENFQVAPGYTIANHTDAPWNAEAIYMAYEDAQAAFGPYLREHCGLADKDDPLKDAVKYVPRKPVMVQAESAILDTVSAEEADSYVTETGGEDHNACFVKLVEIWDAETNAVLTGIQGVKYWAKPSWNPPATTRFYPHFVLTTSEVDGQRHPQSYVTRSMKLVDEYNRIGSAEAEHRRRCLPKMAFNAGAIPPEQAKKLEAARTGELVALELTQPNADLNGILKEVSYPVMNPALYDRQRIKTELEGLWGIQEALQGSIQVAKTATEAEIQQSGFNARSSSRRDLLEGVLSELAQYTVELARVYLTEEDVRHLAGPQAFWPAYTGPDDLSRMVQTEIRAGSSGKPDTAADRQAWSTLLPMLQTGIQQIGQLRGATPSAMADAMEQLLRITAERSGERFDIDQLIPQGDGAMPAPAVPGQPGAPGELPPTEQAPGGDPAADPLTA